MCSLAGEVVINSSFELTINEGSIDIAIRTDVSFSSDQIVTCSNSCNGGDQVSCQDDAGNSYKGTCQRVCCVSCGSTCNLTGCCSC